MYYARHTAKHFFTASLGRKEHKDEWVITAPRVLSVVETLLYSLLQSLRGACWTAEQTTGVTLQLPHSSVAFCWALLVLLEFQIPSLSEG